MNPQPTFVVNVKLWLHSCVSGLLLLGARRHQEYKSGVHLELRQSNMASVN